MEYDLRFTAPITLVGNVVIYMSTFGCNSHTGLHSTPNPLHTQLYTGTGTPNDPPQQVYLNLSPRRVFESGLRWIRVYLNLSQTKRFQETQLYRRKKR